MAQLIFENLIKENQPLFVQKVIDISNYLNINPNWLMAVMKLESNLNPQARNTKYPFKDGYATGLIQFIPSTAKYLGTTTQDLYNMGGLEQLNYVKKYFEPYKNKMKSFIDVYAAVFFPAAIGKSNSYILQTDTLKASTVANSNPIFDLNKDKKITLLEFKNAVASLLPKEITYNVNDTGKIIFSIIGIIATFITAKKLKKFYDEY